VGTKTGCQGDVRMKREWWRKEGGESKGVEKKEGGQ